MSEFSTLLNSYIRQQGYSIRGIAKRLGIPAATLTKLCNGTRSPRNQRETIQRVCDILTLTPSQVDALQGALEKEIVGVERYTSRMSVKMLLEGMKTPDLPQQHLASNSVLPPQAFTDKRADTHGILRAFLENNTAGQGIDVFLATDDPVLLEGLYRILKNSMVKIRHILTMTASDAHNDTATAQNIDNIRKVQQLLLGAGGTYQPFYYYERTHGVSGNALSLPNVLISDTGVLCCSADYSRCIYTSDKMIQKYYRRLFAQQLTVCRPLVTLYNDVHQQIARYERTLDTGNPAEVLRCLSWQPCLLWAVYDWEVSYFLPDQLAFRGDCLKSYLRYLQKIRAREQLQLYFSLDGLMDFIIQGQLREVPPSILPEPLSASFRRELLLRLIHHAETGRACPRIIREEKMSTGKDAQIICYGADTILLSVLDYGINDRVCFIEEFSANWSALDFLENLENTDWLLSVDQTLSIIRELLANYLPEDKENPLAASVFHRKQSVSNARFV